MANKTQSQYAEDWGVKLAAWNKWKKAGAPVGSEKKLANWLRPRQRLNPRTREKMAEVGVKTTTKAKRKQAVQKIESKSKTAEDFRDHYKAQLDEEIQKGEQGDQNQVKFWSELFLKQDESIRRSEIHAAKLGIDNGTTLSRAEVERIFRATMWAGNACVNSNLTMICQHLAGLDQPDDIYNVLMPAIVGGRLFSGFDKVANIKGAPSLPDWVLECIRYEATQYLSNSESLWTGAAKSK
jgi:hypothetical protein